MCRVRRCGQADYISTRRFCLILFLDLPLGLKPVTETSAIERPFALPEFEGSLLDSSLALVVHGLTEVRRTKEQR
ncbi:hypothetical protein EV665_14119 [Shinella granuli]|uniref:Uncharacterized protein n=1 Tax=Shinella granuli TaxID=323621 RepID=A0A4R2C1Y0_SHIGR|nr:hypothetical protein EV665_14119 [Shinella granuli]